MTRRLRQTLALFCIALSLTAARFTYAQSLQWTLLDTPAHAAGPKAPLQLPSGTMLSVRHDDTDDETRLVLARSTYGAAWEDVSSIATDARDTDLGDCHLLRLQDGRLWCAYRRNHFRGAHAKSPRYSIEISESTDDGMTWRKHSIVAEARHVEIPRRSRGLWSSFILEKRDGTLQCYFDDEDTPAREGFAGHQWLVMKTWNVAAAQWTQPVVVSRAHDDKELSRDGMASVAELGDGTLFAAFESVQITAPHANLIRSVTSADGGATWSWRTRDRGVLYEPAKDKFMALAPWMIRRHDGSLFVVFCTDEDRDTPDRSGTPPRRMNLDIKCVMSRDDGKTWSPSQVVHAGGHRNYLPGVVERSNGSLQVHCIDYASNGVRVVRGSKKE